ncbi:ATP-dependent 6-phosphofructokinase, partial [bacterium]|nr:ATP-dependent 6-phosphofructokinase [bacterium]
MRKTTGDFEIQNLGEPKIPSPLTVGYFKSDDERVLCDINIGLHKEISSKPLKSMSLEVAGPRHIIYFEPQKVKAAVVSCGGLCPGINDVIRALVMELHFRYGVRNIIGVKYGLQGLIPRYGHDFLELTPEVVKDIQDLGGSILSSSRGNQGISEMVDALERMNINLFFVIGGDGTMQAAQFITAEIARRKLKIGV